MPLSWHTEAPPQETEIMAKTDTTDPYAPPPMHHDRSGPVLRVALLAGLLGLAGLGYAWLAGQELSLIHI